MPQVGFAQCLLLVRLEVIGLEKIPPTMAFSCHTHLTLTLSCVIWLERVCWACIPVGLLVYTQGGEGPHPRLRRAICSYYMGAPLGGRCVPSVCALSECVAEASFPSGLFLPVLLSSCCPLTSQLCSLVSVCASSFSCAVQLLGYLLIF